MHMHARNLSLALGLTLGGLAACGDDSSTNPVDARPDDAAPDAGPTFKGYDADEGGEVRTEYVRFGGGNAGLRIAAHFYANPGSKKFFDFVNTNGCTDSSLDTTWPTAFNPVAERTYLDPGQVILAGGPSIFNIPRRGAGPDVPGRPHAADQWFFHSTSGAAMDGPTYLTEKKLYDIIITGTDEFPGQIFDDVGYMPADFQVTSPALSLTPFPIPAGTPQTFTWTTPADAPPAGFEIQSLVAFTSAAGGPAVICVEKNDGSVTVPASFIDIVRAKLPGGGTLARQTFTHTVRELKDRNGPTGRRIDFVTVWCYATPFSVP
jgi:hypothetical protein